MSKRRPPRDRAGFELEVAALWSPDIESLEDWVPENAEDVFYCLELEIGPVGSGETHSFQALVATSQGLRAEKERCRHLYKGSPRSLFVFADYSWKAVEQEVLKTVADCTAADFDGSLINLRKRFDWEYENYRG